MGCTGGGVGVDDGVYRDGMLDILQPQWWGLTTCRCLSTVV